MLCVYVCDVCIVCVCYTCMCVVCALCFVYVVLRCLCVFCVCVVCMCVLCICIVCMCLCVAYVFFVWCVCMCVVSVYVVCVLCVCCMYVCGMCMCVVCFVCVFAMVSFIWGFGISAEQCLPFSGILLGNRETQAQFFYMVVPRAYISHFGVREQGARSECGLRVIRTCLIIRHHSKEKSAVSMENFPLSSTSCGGGVGDV